MDQVVLDPLEEKQGTCLLNLKMFPARLLPSTQVQRVAMELPEQKHLAAGSAERPLCLKSLLEDEVEMLEALVHQAVAVAVELQQF
jgi:hypothetical protein